MRYRADLPEVLKGASFACKGGAKVGICGRTASGKSSLFMALARLAETTAGGIEIDGLAAAELPLATLRGCIAWVPQEPSFFTGSLRLNLDPFGAFDDAALCAALESVEMSEALSAGLATPVAEGGANFSIGERQLLSLARALLARRRIICMDEAFANVDFATDAKVQKAVKALAQETGATVLVVAHRLQSLADSDCVVVMGDGVVLEHGAPAELLERGGAYAALVAQAERAERAEQAEQVEQGVNLWLSM